MIVYLWFIVIFVKLTLSHLIKLRLIFKNRKIEKLNISRTGMQAVGIYFKVKYLFDVNN